MRRGDAVPDGPIQAMNGRRGTLTGVAHLCCRDPISDDIERGCIEVLTRVPSRRARFMAARDIPPGTVELPSSMARVTVFARSELEGRARCRD
jgi:hypothetical protein